MATSSMSRAFLDFVKAIGESKTKQEEDRIVVHELSKLKKDLFNTRPSSVCERPQVASWASR